VEEKAVMLILDNKGREVSNYYYYYYYYYF